VNSDLTLNEILPDLLPTAVSDRMANLQKQMMILTQYQRMMDLAAWSEMIPITQPLKSVGVKGTDVGVYAYSYKPTGEIFYIGQGVICSRVARFRSVFANDGEIVNDSNYHAAKKAYAMDADINNWQVQALVLNVEKDTAKGLASVIETDYIDNFSPKFNSESMAGKG
jgi:hypothetical protein